MSSAFSFHSELEMPEDMKGNFCDNLASMSQHS